mmetsp:Transcript_4746/g.15315  ORF Transcript_4746/g.15315 Transcript_4746/m.15315 type:complete len:212 (-) Transcript_4746:389-1024(-)
MHPPSLGTQRSARRDLGQALLDLADEIVTLLHPARDEGGDPLRGPPLADHRGVRHGQAEAVWGGYEVQRLLPSLQQHHGAGFAHLLHSVAGELHDLALRLLGDRGDVLAHPRLLQQRVGHLRNLHIHAQAVHPDVKLLAELAELQHAGPSRKVLRRQARGVEGLLPGLLAVRGGEKREGAEAVAVGPRRGVRHLGLDLVDGRALARAAEAH